MSSVNLSSISRISDITVNHVLDSCASNVLNHNGFMNQLKVRNVKDQFADVMTVSIRLERVRKS